MTGIPRRAGLGEREFLDDHLRANRPVIVTDAMTDWRAPRLWGPRYFADKFGDADVQVYDELFSLVDVEPLAAYLARNFDKPEGAASTEYVRGYVRFKDVDFVWSDDLFRDLAADWGHPYFFPREAFVLPRAPSGRAISPVADLFPYKGLFISGRGARTRLHRDPFGTDAMLCQFHGEKRVVFYEPHHAPDVMRGGVFVDPAAVDRAAFPAFERLTPSYDDVLVPGEILFIPGGWFHDVVTLADSISITWNFVHGARPELYRREVANPENTFDRDMLAYLGGVP